MDIGLLKKLVDHTINHDEKCSLALQIFSSQEISIPRKEEVIFYWITEGMKSLKGSATDISSLLDVLMNCFFDERAKILAYGWLSPSLTHSLIEEFSKLFEKYPEYIDKYSKILFSMFKNLHFDRYLRSHIDIYVDLIAAYVNLSLNTKNEGAEETVAFFLSTLGHLTNMKELTFSKRKFEMEAIQKLYIPLVCFYEKILSTQKSHKLHNVNERLLNCISKVMFSDYLNSVLLSTHLKKFIESEKEGGEKELPFHLLMNTLKSNAQNTVENGWKLFLTYFMEVPEMKKLKINEVLDVCIVISSFIKKPAFDAGFPIECIGHYMTVYENILAILSESQVVRNTSGRISDLASWLNKLLKHLFKSIDKQLLPEKIKLLNTTFILYPTFIDDTLHTFIDAVALKPKDSKNIQQLYVQSLEAVLQNFRKSHRVPKFIFQFLMFTSNSLTTQNQSDLNPVTLYDVLPPSFISKFCVTLSLLQSTSTSAALDKLYFFLNKFIIFLQDSQSKIDDNRMLLCEILCEVYCCFLTGARLADQNVPEIVRLSHQEKMSDLAKLLSNFGKALLTRKHNQRLMLAYLRLCLTWGDVELLMVRYVDARIRVPKQTDNSATNLIYIHSYLSDYHWNLIAQRVINFGFDKCKDTLHSLILQKIQALPLLEDEIEGIYTDGEDKDGPRCIAARYLLNNARFEWFTKNVDSILPELEPDEVLKFAKTFVQQCLHDSIHKGSEKLELPPICEKNAQLVFAMALYTFYDCGKKLTKFKVKSTRNILKSLDYEKLIEVEDKLLCNNNDNFQELVRDLGTELSSMWREVPESDDSDFDISILKTNIELLSALPLKYLSPESRTILSCLVFAVCRDISSADLQTDVNKSTLIILWNLTLSVLQNKVFFPSTFEWSNIILWFNKNSLDYKYHKELSVALLEIAVSKQAWIPPLVDSIVAATEKELSTDKIIPKHHADLLSSVMNILSSTRQAEKRKGSSIMTLNKIRKKGLDSLSDNFESLVGQVAPSILLNSYSVALETALTGNNEANIKRLTAFIGKFMATALKSADTDPVSLKFLRTLVIHRKTLREYVTTDVLLKIWTAELVHPTEDAIKNILDVTFMNELERILSLSKISLHSFINQDKFHSDSFRIVCFICLGLVSMSRSKLKKRQENELKMRSRQVFLNYVFSKFSNKLHSWHHEKFKMCHEDKALLLQLISSTVLSHELKFDGQILDFCLEVVSFFAEDLSVCVASIDVLFTLLSRRSSLTMDCLPAFSQRYLALINAISAKSDTNEHVSENDVHLLASYAYKIEKLTSQMEKHTKEFSRIAPLLIADLLLIFQKWTIHKLVKAHLMNSIFTLIRMCDRNSTKFLNANLPYTSLEIFKKVEQDFEKSFKYSGKV